MPVSSIEKRLKKLPDPLSKLWKRFKHSQVDPSHDVLRFMHQPWEGVESYAFWLFPPATKKDFKTFEKIHGFRIHDVYREMLLASNGFQAFGLEFFGMSPSMLKEPPLLDRSGYQCIDLSSANQTRSSFNVDSDWFYFGGRNYTEDENCGYFLNPNGAIHSYLPGGERVKRWRSWDRFLEHEVDAAESFARSEYPSEWKEFDQQRPTHC